MAHDELDYQANGYESGNYHPVHAGELYNGHYKVYRKLGFGMYSTVWLVKDITIGRYFAMKVLTRLAYGGEKGLFELEILQHLDKADTSHLGHKHVLQLHDHFVHEGPTGRYVCFVFPVMGESLKTFREKCEDDCIPRPILKRIAKQLLQALHYAHSNGVIHTDISQQNIIIKIKDEGVIDDLYFPDTEDSIFPQGTKDTDDTKNTSDTELDSLHSPNSDKLPPWEVLSILLTDYHFGTEPATEDVFKLNVALCDWGVVSWTDKHLTEVVVPIPLRSPELLIEAEWGPKVDIWALGCWDKLVEDVFDDEGKIRDPTADPNWGNCNWVMLVSAIKNLKREEKDNFVKMLKKMLILDPEKRKTARELLDEPWLQDVDAVPEGYSLEKIEHEN